MTNIFVGNLSYQTTQEDLQAAFSQYGNVERVNIVTDRDTGQPRGFAFVEMTEKRDAETAIAQLNGAEMNGRAINVNEARPKPTGGGGGGFGGGAAAAAAAVAVAAAVVVAAVVHAGKSSIFSRKAAVDTRPPRAPKPVPPLPGS